MNCIKNALISLAVVFLTANLSAEIRYIEIDNIKNAQIIEIKNLDDFETIINQYDIKIGFLQKTSSSENSRNSYGSSNNSVPSKTLYIIADSVYFSFPMNGYSTLTDYRTGIEKGFKNGADYSKAIEKGFDSGEVYYYFARNSFKSPEDCKDAYKKGFVGKNNQYRNPDRFTFDGALSNAKESDAYYDAQNLGYSDFKEYQDFAEFTSKGFKNKTEWNDAKQKGFSSASEYHNALENGFNDSKTYMSAKKLNFTSKEEYDNYLVIINSAEQIAVQREIKLKYAILYYYISLLPKGEASTTALEANLKSILKEQGETTNKALGQWYYDTLQNSNNSYSKDINNQKYLNFETLFSLSSIKSFFSQTDISQLGSYNPQTDIFKKK